MPSILVFFALSLHDLPRSIAQSNTLELPLVSEFARVMNPKPVVLPLAEATLSIGNVRYLGFSEDGASIRVGSTTGKHQQLSSVDLKPASERISLFPFGIAVSVLSQDHKLSLIGGWNGNIMMFDPQKETIQAQLPAKPDLDTTAVSAIDLAYDASQCFVGNRSSIVRMYRIANSEMVWESEPLVQEITGVSVSKDGKFVVVSTGVQKQTNSPGKIVVLDGATGKIKQSWLDMKSRVNHVAIANDSRTLVAAENFGIRIYDLVTGEKLHTIPQLFAVQRIKFIDDTRCAVSQYPNGLSLFDVQSQKILVTYAGHKLGPLGAPAQLIWSLDVAPDGKKLASADSLGQAYLWPIP